MSMSNAKWRIVLPAMLALGMTAFSTLSATAATVIIDTGESDNTVTATGGGFNTDTQNMPAGVLSWGREIRVSNFGSGTTTGTSGSGMLGVKNGDDNGGFVKFIYKELMQDQLAFFDMTGGGTNDAFIVDLI